MARLRALAGSLVLLTTAHRVTARGRPWEEYDEVALVQRAATAREGRAAQLAEQAAAVQSSLTDLLAQRRRSSPFSLLAVNASRWYEMDDGMLLQKLHDRMKANEEKEQEDLANAQAVSENGAPEGAAFLTQGAAAPASIRKDNAAQWLTQADIDHYSDDERRLHQLSTELQRVAASIAKIATHQREIGMHLGLPDPATVKFEAGDKVELQVGEGAKAGQWIKASIIGPGDRPNTWNIHVPSTRKGNKDMPNVPAMALRRDEDPEGSKLFEPSEAKYDVGEQAQVQIAVGPMSGQWVRCSIKSKADLPDAYNIYVPSAPVGHRDIPSVPARVLRKAESKGLFQQYDMDGDGLLSAEEFKVAMREKASAIYQEEEKKSQLFEDGEAAQVFSIDGATMGSWINCTIMNIGDLANSWNIFIPDAAIGFQYVQNIPTERLRKMGENKTAAEAMGHGIRVIPEQAGHEVLLSQGQYAGRWVPCEVRHKSDSDDTYTIWVPFGAPDGRSVMPNMVAEKIRERRTCGKSYEDIFDADSPGYDHYDRPYNRKETSEDCALDCSKRFSCRSYEWSPTVKECHLNRVLDPSLPANGDYLFCRRKVVPQSAADFWEGPWIGQELQYLVTTGEYNGTWHPCKLEGYGQKPDTYDILASVEYLGAAQKIVNVSGVPSSSLRYSEDKPMPILVENWEPPEGAEALYSNRFPAEEAAAPANATEGAAPANGTELASIDGDTIADQVPEAALLIPLSPAKLSEASAANATNATAETLSLEAVDEAEAEAAGEQEKDSLEGEDLGEDLPEGVYRANQIVEMKQAGSWVKCRVQSNGSLADTYNLNFLSDPEGKQDLWNIPGIALRKVQRQKEVSAELLDAEGIDGEVGESVEVKIYHGQYAGQWVPGIIKAHGSVPDSYDVRVGTNKLVKNVLGIAMRRAEKKVFIQEEETEWQTFTDSEHAMVVLPLGANSTIEYNCTVLGRGAAKNTYDLQVPSFGTFPAAHARFLRKLSPEEAAQVAVQDAAEDRLAISLAGTMKLLEATKADLLPVFTSVMDARRELRLWIKRAEDWSSTCDQSDRQNMAAKLQELSTMSREAVAAAVPEECSLARWTQEGFAWDQLAACFEASMNVSRACSSCPAKFMMSAADKCVPKCTPMMSLCRTEEGQATTKCQLSVGRCLDCMQQPISTFMDCAEVSQRSGLMAGIAAMVKNSKTEGNLRVEAALKDNVDMPMFLGIDQMARHALRTLLFSWGRFMSRREL